MRTIGKGRASLDTFTAMIGMLPPVSKPSYSYHNEKIAAATSLELEAQFSAAAALLRKDAALVEIVDIHVTCDGTWSRRGHQTKCIIVAASWENRLVLDSEVLSKFYYEWHAKKTNPASDDFLDWWEEHQGNCDQNYYGSSVGIEAEGARRMWQRSIEKYKLRYIEVVADGDSKTFSELTKWKPYGEGNPVVKHECVGHVQKHMTNRIEALKKTKPKDDNGELIKIGGKGRVTKEVVAASKSTLARLSVGTRMTQRG